MGYLRIIIISGLLSLFLFPAAKAAGPEFRGALENGMKNTRVEAGYTQAGETQAGGYALEVMIANVVKTALSFVGLLFFILTIYAGVMWMTAGGSEEKIGKAKRMLRNAVIGMIVVFASYAITALVLSAIS